MKYFIFKILMMSIFISSSYAFTFSCDKEKDSKYIFIFDKTKIIAKDFFPYGDYTCISINREDLIKIETENPALKNLLSEKIKELSFCRENIFIIRKR